MKKTFILLGIVAMISFSIIMTGCTSQQTDEEWLQIFEIKEYKGLLDYPIDKITLRLGITSPEWAVFSDDDLVLEWSEWLKTVKLKREDKQSEIGNQALNGGGMLIAVISVNGRDYSIGISQASEECKLEISGIVYATDSTNNPFDKTYGEGIERHGITTPWDQTSYSRIDDKGYVQDAHLLIDRVEIVDIQSDNCILVKIMNDPEHEKDDYSFANGDIVSACFSEDNQRAIDFIGKLHVGSIVNISRYNTTKPQKATPHMTLECTGIDIYDDKGEEIVEFF